MPNGEEYDVAISFLSRDSDTAVAIADRLAPLSVFCFPRNQEELAGNDGMEAFRNAFRHQSRTQVVLFRAGWGETPWTRVEQTAITERCLAEGWRGLFFVALDDADRPNWVPDTEIHFDLTTYTMDQLAGAVKARAQELGAEIRVETPIERARRAQASAEYETQTRELFRGQEGVNLARQEAASMCDLIASSITDAAQDLGIEIRQARTIRHGIGWSAPTAGCQAIFNSYANMIDAERGFEVTLFKHNIVLPGENLMYANPNMPQRHSHDCFRIRRSMELGMCWEIQDGSLLSSNNLADKILNDFWSVYEESVVDPLVVDW